VPIVFNPQAFQQKPGLFDALGYAGQAGAQASGMMTDALRIRAQVDAAKQAIRESEEESAQRRELLPLKIQEAQAGIASQQGQTAYYDQLRKSRAEESAGAPVLGKARGDLLDPNTAWEGRLERARAVLPSLSPEGQKLLLGDLAEEEKRNRIGKSITDLEDMFGDDVAAQQTGGAPNEDILQRYQDFGQALQVIRGLPPDDAAGAIERLIAARGQLRDADRKERVETARQQSAISEIEGLLGQITSTEDPRFGPLSEALAEAQTSKDPSAAVKRAYAASRGKVMMEVGGIEMELGPAQAQVLQARMAQAAIAKMMGASRGAGGSKRGAGKGGGFNSDLHSAAHKFAGGEDAQATDPAMYDSRYSRFIEQNKRVKVAEIDDRIAKRFPQGGGGTPDSGVMPEAEAQPKPRPKNTGPVDTVPNEAAFRIETKDPAGRSAHGAQVTQAQLTSRGYKTVGDVLRDINKFKTSNPAIAETLSKWLREDAEAWTSGRRGVEERQRAKADEEKAKESASAKAMEETRLRKFQAGAKP
jgi:hypothetical protein